MVTCPPPPAPPDLIIEALLRRGHFPGGSVVKNPPANAGDLVHSLGWENPLEKEMATHPSILLWRIPGTGAVAHGFAKSWIQLSN